jgi:hypothetical protein
VAASMVWQLGSGGGPNTAGRGRSNSHQHSLFESHLCYLTISTTFTLWPLFSCTQVLELGIHRNILARFQETAILKLVRGEDLVSTRDGKCARGILCLLKNGIV